MGAKIKFTIFCRYKKKEIKKYPLSGNLFKVRTNSKG